MSDVDLSILTQRSPEVEKIGRLVVETADVPIQYINMCVYGEAGTGKTVLAGSASEVPEMSPVLLVDIEGGSMSLRGRSKVDIIRITTMKDLQSLYDQLYAGKLPYKTIILDSLTELQKFSMNDIMKEVVQKDSDRDPDVASLREWGKNGEQMRRMVRGFRDLPMNVIYTALVRSAKDERSGVTMNRPALMGQLGGELPGYMDIVVYMHTSIQRGAIIRKLQTVGTATTVAKDRSWSLPAVIEDPTMADLYAYIFRNPASNEQRNKVDGND